MWLSEYLYTFKMQLLLAQIGLQQLVFCVVAQSADGLFLDLADALTCQTVFLADFLQRHLWLIDAEEGLDDTALALAQ